MSPVRTQRDEALDVLRKVYPKGSTVYTILRHRSRSGGTAQVTLMAATSENGPDVDLWFPHYAAAIITGYRQGSWEGHDTLILPGFTSADMIRDRIALALYGDPDALTHRSI